LADLGLSTLGELAAYFNRTDVADVEKQSAESTKTLADDATPE